MDDENGVSLEPMEEVPFIGLGESEMDGAWLTEGSRELVPETRGSILEGTICIRREDDVDRRVSVTKDDERVLLGG